MSNPTNPPHIETRIASVEASYQSLHEDVSGLKLELRNVSQAVASGFDSMRREYSQAFDAVRREQSQAKQVNWGWIAAFLAVGVAIVGSVLNSLVQPLQMFDSSMKDRVGTVESRSDVALERGIRNDERIRQLEKWYEREHPPARP